MYKRQALYGVDLGFDNTSVLVISAKRLAQLTGDLNIVTGGIKFDDNYIIHVKNNKDVYKRQALRNAMDMFLNIANVIVGVFKGIMTVWNLSLIHIWSDES